MSQQRTKPENFVSVEEYLLKEAKAVYKSEYRNGTVVAMAGAQPAHHLLTARLAGLLDACLANTDCLVFSSDQLVYVPECAHFVYPDITVTCQQPDYLGSNGGLDALRNPTLIIEVLSESTVHYDRGEKFLCYRTLPSLEQYVLVAPQEMLIETFTKQDARHWLMTIAREADEKVRLATCEFLMGDVYRKIIPENH